MRRFQRLCINKVGIESCCWAQFGPLGCHTGADRLLQTTLPVCIPNPTVATPPMAFHAS